MELKEFLEHVNRRELLNTPEIYEFMNRMSDTARRITCRINGEYQTPEQIRDLVSELFGYRVDETFRLFPPFYTDFGRNIHVGRNVFINAACHFQDQGGVTIGDGCVIGAGSVVTRDIPPLSFAAGNPCRVIREITEADSMVRKPEILADNRPMPR